MEFTYTITEVRPEQCEMTIQYSCAEPNNELQPTFISLRIPTDDNGEIVSQNELRAFINQYAPVEFFADMLKVKPSTESIETLIGFTGVGNREPVFMSAPNPLTEDWE